MLQSLNREIIPVVREMLRSMAKPPTPFVWSSGAATLDLASGRDFSAAAVLTENATLTLSNGFDGAEGTIYVQQDGVGGRTMTVVADGRTILREAPFLDDDPGAAPNELTQYRYTYLTAAGTAYVVLERIYLL